MLSLRTWAIGALVGCAVLFGTSCDTSPSSAGDDEITRANFLIEQKQYSEAIYVLIERIKRNPKDLRARVVLSSAYAARAGIALTSYTDFANELSKWNKIDEILPGEDDEETVQKIAKASVRLQLVIRAFHTIPSPVAATALSDIQLGLVTLEHAGHLSGGPALYRALFRILLFKVELLGRRIPKIEKGCIAEVAEVSRWLQTMLTALDVIFADVAMGFTDAGMRENVLRFAQQVREAAGGVNFVANTTEPLAKFRLPPSLRKVLGPCE